MSSTRTRSGVHARRSPAPDLTGLHPNAVTVAQALAGLGVAGTVRALPEPAAVPAPAPTAPTPGGAAMTATAETRPTPSAPARPHLEVALDPAPAEQVPAASRATRGTTSPRCARTARGRR